MTYEELLTSYPTFLDEAKITSLQLFADLLLKANETMNLTAITSMDEVVSKHFYDSLLLAKTASFDGKTLVDLGTGAGFPGLVLAIAFPSLSVSLVEATGKKCRFLENTIAELKLPNVKVINARAEELHLKGTFDFATARALGDLRLIMEFSAPLLKVKGRLLAMRGAKGREEEKESARAAKILHLRLVSLDSESLPHEEGSRLNLVYELEKTPDPKYPRTYALMLKSPL